jgi:hypothetical protein
MFYACEYDSSGRIVEVRGGRSALSFLRGYEGSNTLRMSEAHSEFPGIEVGPVYQAGYNIDGTPPAARQKYDDELDYALSKYAPAQARTFIVRQMKRKALSTLAGYRDYADADFGDPEMLSEGRALRDEFKALIQAAASATNEAELRSAWESIKEKTGG